MLVKRRGPPASRVLSPRAIWLRCLTKRSFDEEYAAFKFFNFLLGSYYSSQTCVWMLSLVFPLLAALPI